MQHIASVVKIPNPKSKSKAGGRAQHLGVPHLGTVANDIHRETGRSVPPSRRRPSSSSRVSRRTADCIWRLRSFTLHDRLLGAARITSQSDIMVAFDTKGRR